MYIYHCRTIKLWYKIYIYSFKYQGEVIIQSSEKKKIMTLVRYFFSELKAERQAKRDSEVAAEAFKELDSNNDNL